MNVCENCARPIGDGETHTDCSPRFGISLKAFRMKFRMSLRSFSKKVGLDSSYTSCVERGVIKPGQDFLDRLIKVIDETVTNKNLKDAYKTRFRIALKENNILPWDGKKHLPAFPSINGKKPTAKEYDKLVEKINEMTDKRNGE